MKKKHLNRTLRPNVELVYAQIVKDLHLAAIPFSNPMQEPNDFENLHKVVAAILSEVIIENSSKLQQWIYTIDIPEKNIVSLNAHGGSVSELADLIIRRTELKIILRQEYSDSENHKRLK